MEYGQWKCMKTLGELWWVWLMAQWNVGFENGWRTFFSIQDKTVALLCNET